MTSVRSGRSQLPGGYNSYLDRTERSLSRDDLARESRGERYGRASLPTDSRKGGEMGRDDGKMGGPDQDMQSSRGGGGYGGGGYGGGGR